MKLYAYPFSCSQAALVSARLAEVPLNVVWVDEPSKTLPDGSSYLVVAPKGKVPGLELPDGALLTELPAVLQFIADQAPGTGLAPSPGSPDRYRLQEVLNFIGTELHKQVFFPLLNARKTADRISPDALRPFLVSLLGPQLEHVARTLADQSFILGDRFTVADAYLLVILNWCRFIGFKLDPWPNLSDYRQRLMSISAIQDVIDIERRIPNAFASLRPGWI